MSNSTWIKIVEVGGPGHFAISASTRDSTCSFLQLQRDVSRGGDQVSNMAGEGDDIGTKREPRIFYFLEAGAQPATGLLHPGQRCAQDIYSFTLAPASSTSCNASTLPSPARPWPIHWPRPGSSVRPACHSVPVSVIWCGPGLELFPYLPLCEP